MPLPLAPIERTIEAFEKAAREYHNLRLSKPRTSDQKKEIDKELKLRLADLKQRKLMLTTEADIHDKVAKMQVDLNAYQERNRAKAGESDDDADVRVSRLTEESHHPTKALRDNMFAIGDLPPDDNCACHHIVAGQGKSIIDRKTGKRKQSQNAIEARAILHFLGLGINDPSNGVYLPSSSDYIPHWRFPRALSHANIHTLAYEKMVNDKIKFLESELALRNQLAGLRSMLENGEETFFLTKRSEKKYFEKVA